MFADISFAKELLIYGTILIKCNIVDFSSLKRTF